MSGKRWLDALEGARAQWESVVHHAGWHVLLVAGGYAVVAGLCGLAGGAERRDGAAHGGWIVAAALLALLGASALLQLDVLLVESMRAVARAQGWYGGRRAMQYAFLVALAAGGLAVLSSLRSRLAGRWPERAPVVLGIALLASLAALKGVSFHYTDGLVNASLAGASLGRLAEAAGLGLVAVGALRRLGTA